MFTSLFTNKYIDTSQDCELFLLPFNYLYSRQTFSEEIEILFTVNRVLCVTSYVKSSRATWKTKMAGHAQHGDHLSLWYIKSCVSSFQPFPYKVRQIHVDNFIYALF